MDYKPLKYFSELVIARVCLLCSCMILGMVQNVSASAPGSYIGIDAGLTYTKYQKDYGSEIFTHKPMAQTYGYIGYQLAPLIGVELGYAQSLAQKGSTYVPAATSQFGIANFTALAPSNYDTKQTMRGFNLFYAPQLQVYSRVFCMLLLGFEYITTESNLTLSYFDGDLATDAEKAQYQLDFKAKNFIPKLGMRVQYSISPRALLHIYLSWAQTDRITMYATRSIFSTQILTAKLKNTTNCGIGILYKFNVC